MSKIENPLGKNIEYPSKYNPNILFPICRKNHIEIPHISYEGFDLWNAYELSWLNKNGKPEIAIGKFQFPCNSKNIIESKSLKIYLNSLNQTRFIDHNDLQKTIYKDLSIATESNVLVDIIMPSNFKDMHMEDLDGLCIDNINIETNTYLPSPELLKNDNQKNIAYVNETIMSRLLRSNCPITKQPDWACIQIKYRGFKINHESLLKYIISYRNHDAYHENCIEKIFVDIMQNCNPEFLSVYAKYTRRGGIDINPWRTTNLQEYNPIINNTKTTRQ
ncbi:7-cyano-7-deazaguanine reductase [Candidatus Kinetoplastibacterium desouzaii TCC079E]|uniref:7-cyano-7-deazaguanine reductase n=1 Tax=Candidatus Kinetoplastidibacterium desouzai TCC079E TaxID=1208919 RepID=M1M3C9_9PROT|nr:NADPH-dependent 7-cyano-7-deazaguanine reductase QueF [Candidatus Kinetoplastibacterium desouzaii]AGF46740.1 7-cyano-7-deazaguanine reductase [Candidatus Kinetoplastibacterium desouzaii TCC079E]